MKTKQRIIGLILLAATSLAVQAQTVVPIAGEAVAPPSVAALPAEADLEKLVGPIALYPDPLLSILLPASAYPLDIVKAARFIKDTNNISQVDSQPWDSNVKSLAHFPTVINKLNDDLDWTSSLGQAFAQDQKAVMNAIQVMRGRAQQAGSLQTTPQQVVVVTNTIIEIQPAQTQVIYVPEYNPAVVYVGPSPGEVAAASFVSFGVGMAVGAIIANNCDWHSGGIYVGPHGGVVWGGGYHGDVNINRNVNVNVNNNFNHNVNQNANVNRNGNLGGAQKWQPDASRRPAASVGASSESRGWSGGANNSSGSAFNNSGGGAQTRAASTRGAASRGGGGGRGGGLRGRR